MSSAPHTASLADRFALIIGGLCQATVLRLGPGRAAGPLLILIVARLRRLASRFASLAAGDQAGRTRHSRPAAPRPSRPRQRPLPEGWGWLVRLAQPTAAYAGQVEHLLSDPEMQALLAAHPEAGRILRPLCRMLAIRPAPGVLPPPPPRAAPSRPEPSVSRPRHPARRRPEPPEPEPPEPGPPDLASPAPVWRRWRGILMPMPPGAAEPA